MEHPHESAKINWVSKNNVAMILDKLDQSQWKSSPVQIVSFFAEWCPNCENEVRSIKLLYDKYNAYGLEVYLIMDYAPKRISIQFIKKHDLLMPFQFGESDKKETKNRNKTVFYQFRKNLGDKREWGVPTHLIFEKNPEKFGVIFGEIILNEINTYFDDKLINQ